MTSLSESEDRKRRPRLRDASKRLKNFVVRVVIVIINLENVFPLSDVETLATGTITEVLLVLGRAKNYSAMRMLDTLENDFLLRSRHAINDDDVFPIGVRLHVNAVAQPLERGSNECWCQH